MKIRIKIVLALLHLMQIGVGWSQNLLFFFFSFIQQSKITAYLDRWSLSKNESISFNLLNDPFKLVIVPLYGA